MENHTNFMEKSEKGESKLKPERWVHGTFYYRLSLVKKYFSRGDYHKK